MNDLMHRTHIQSILKAGCRRMQLNGVTAFCIKTEILNMTKTVRSHRLGYFRPLKRCKTRAIIFLKKTELKII